MAHVTHDSDLEAAVDALVVFTARHYPIDRTRLRKTPVDTAPTHLSWDEVVAVALVRGWVTRAQDNTLIPTLAGLCRYSLVTKTTGLSWSDAEWGEGVDEEGEA